MNYPEPVKRAIQIAQSLSREYQNELFGPAHLLKGLLHNDVGLASWLATLHQDIHYLREWADVHIEDYPRSGRQSENPPGDEKVKAVMELAELVRMQLGKAVADAVTVLAALLKPGLAFAADQLKTLPLTQKELMAAALDEEAAAQAVSSSRAHPGTGPDLVPAGAGIISATLLKYCLDKTEMAREGRLDPIIGRDREIRMMAEILGRRTKPNVILVGEPGVGKTALVEGFAQHIASGAMPGYLKNACVLELDTGALVAGAAYKGEVEDRLKGIIRDLKNLEKAVLFIDEIHLLLDNRGSLGTGVVNLLKPELARGELTVIGATTSDEYRKYLETDEAFSRRFEVLRVEEPDVPTTVRMLERLLPSYEHHHGLKVTSEAVHEAVRLSQRYVKDRRLPDAAVDLLDRTLAAIRMAGETSRRELEELQQQLATMNGAANDLSELRWFHQQLLHKISPVLLGQLEEDTHPEELDLPAAMQEYLSGKLASLLKLTEVRKESVDKQDVAAIISHKTGIPLGKIQSQERDKLLTMDAVLKKRVIGQDHAVKALSDAMLESRSGLTKAGQPTGSFFLLGPTGTGKTELAKSLADFLFNDESFLIRFDMSEFKEEHSAALLIGAPPSYVGYEEGGLLVNKIREKPYAVVLFDEIEKAHPSVFDIFLQILDEGRLQDRLGKEGDFSNAVILFTSNIGADFVMKKFHGNQIPAARDIMKIMSRYFRPEFLARLTEIVPFAPISEENAVKIFALHLRGLSDLLNKQGITLQISPEARQHLALSEFTPKYGARQLKGVIRNALRRPISRMIVAGEVGKGSTLQVSLSPELELIWNLVKT
jgi:ATP-dependent Clp protease ATP-binding subunit ClpB